MIDWIIILDIFIKPNYSATTVFAISVWSFIGGMIVMKIKTKKEGLLK